MKKIANLLLFASCLMLMNNIKIQNNVDFYESTNDILDKDIEELIQKRADAKKNKDFKLADEIRQELLDKGIVLEDTRQGTKWKRV